MQSVVNTIYLCTYFHCCNVDHIPAAAMLKSNVPAARDELNVGHAMRDDIVLHLPQPWAPSVQYPNTETTEARACVEV
jgi:hypothetical protein